MVGTLAPKPLAELLQRHLDIVRQLAVLDLRPQVLIDLHQQAFRTTALHGVAEVGLFLGQTKSQGCCWHDRIVTDTSNHQ